MAWPFERRLRQLPNEEYIPLFRKWCDTYAQAIVDAGTVAISLGEDDRIPIPDILKEFDAVLPQYKPYRPIHRAFVKLAWAQLTAIMCLARVKAIQNTAKTLRELAEGSKASRCEELMEGAALHERRAAQLNHELERRLEALPGSDPIRLIIVEEGKRVYEATWLKEDQGNTP